MKGISEWDLILQGDFVGACRQADQNFIETGDVLGLRNKTLALLLMDSPDQAASNCLQIIQSTDGNTDSDFITLGVCYWVSGRQPEAVTAWRKALGTKYTDAAGGVEAPLFLWFAATKTNDEPLLREAQKRLVNVTKARRADNWPGPLARYVAGKCGAAAVDAAMSQQPIVRMKQSCQRDFFYGVMDLASNRSNQGRHYFESCVGYGLVAVVKAEYHLARHELNAKS